MNLRETELLALNAAYAATITCETNIEHFGGIYFKGRNFRKRNFQEDKNSRNLGNKLLQMAKYF